MKKIGEEIENNQRQIQTKRGRALKTVVEREFGIFGQRETQTNNDNTNGEAQLTSNRDSRAGRQFDAHETRQRQTNTDKIN